MLHISVCFTHMHLTSQYCVVRYWWIVYCCFSFSCNIALNANQGLLWFLHWTYYVLQCSFLMHFIGCPDILITTFLMHARALNHCISLDWSLYFWGVSFVFVKFGYCILWMCANAFNRSPWHAGRDFSDAHKCGESLPLVIFYTGPQLSEGNVEKFEKWKCWKF